MNSIVDLQAFRVSGQVVDQQLPVVPDALPDDPGVTSETRVITQLESCSDGSVDADVVMATSLMNLARRLHQQNQDNR
ncbi:hypothetical protein KDA00_01920 [Candidatus Saccharibacteria bacterium]|nr:hypothetical protein [Candidatus Saccharibacteria bacterium]